MKKKLTFPKDYTDGSVDVVWDSYGRKFIFYREEGKDHAIVDTALHGKDVFDRLKDRLPEGFTLNAMSDPKTKKDKK